MSKDENKLMKMVHNPKTGGFTISLERKVCTDCGNPDLYKNNEKMALEYLRDTPDRYERLLELIEVIGWANVWVCRSCKAFGATPMLL